MYFIVDGKATLNVNGKIESGFPAESVDSSLKTSVRLLLLSWHSVKKARSSGLGRLLPYDLVETLQERTSGILFSSFDKPG